MKSYPGKDLSMEFSSKITRSVYLHLENQGHVAGDHLEKVNLQTGKALDPEQWLNASQVEAFLDGIVKEIPNFNPKEVALQAPDLRGWGLLDQVLRIIGSSSEIYESPQSFLSYFIKPELYLNWLERSDNVSTFQVSLSTDEYPLVTNYITGALEAVSLFLGEGGACASWVGTTVSIDWSKKQNSIFSEEVPKNLKPEIFKEAVQIIQKQQTELTAFKGQSVEEPVLDTEVLLKSLNQLEDYFLRARQLVSLLNAESGKKKWFREALKRLHWSDLQIRHHEKIKEMRALLKGDVQTETSSEEEQIQFQLEN